MGVPPDPPLIAHDGCRLDPDPHQTNDASAKRTRRSPSPSFVTVHVESLPGPRVLDEGMKAGEHRHDQAVHPIAIPAACIGKEDGTELRAWLKRDRSLRASIDMRNSNGLVSARNIIATLPGDPHA